jgi:hypothetical protein
VGIGRPSLTIDKDMRFTRLLVLELLPERNGGHRMFRCLCDCGTTKTIAGSDLVNGRVKSCGCLKIEVCSERLLTAPIGRSHGYTANGEQHALYSTWISMRHRCTNVKRKQYKDYGGRGIKVCARWQGRQGFANFLADMGERPDGLTLDRIDNEGNYEPGNCRWATWKQQAANKRPKPKRPTPQ